MAEYTVDDSVLARRILTFMGRATTSSLEPGADQFADRLATKLAEWREQAAAVQSSPAPASMMNAKEFFAEARRLGLKLPDALSLAAAPGLNASGGTVE